MINFEALQSNVYSLRADWSSASPFSILVLDDFCDTDKLNNLLSELPDPEDVGLKKSRDYMFAKNKFEKSGFAEFGGNSSELYEDLVSEEFRNWLSQVCGREIWVDKDFHGGGLHQGGAGSFLDMHVDFNVHPLHDDWFRDLNILLYLNKDWRPDYGGELKLRNKHTGASRIVEPIFNRCVIMETRDYTMHGYDPISFPEGSYRRSIACYAYSAKKEDMKSRSTVWYPEKGNLLKRATGRLWPTLVRVKGRLFGSGTAGNR